MAKDINVSARRINEIVHGERTISADTALRLGKYFGVSPEFWLNLQTHYDLEMQSDIFEKKSEFGKIIPLRPMRSLRGVLKGISTSIKREKVQCRHLDARR